MTTRSEIPARLFDLRDDKYGEFQRKLIPNIPPETVVGVRTPELRRLAKDLSGGEGTEEFLTDLPHGYFEENQLHAFIISLNKNFDEAAEQVEAFLPYVDNWATCDQMSPKVFQKHKSELLNYILTWLKTGRTYTVRFAIGMLMQHYLEENFDPSYPELVSQIRSEEYYVNMMIAWYFATALAKQYDAVLPYLEKNKLAPWTHNKTIQKAVESYRITPEQKAYLKTLKRK